MKSYMHGIGMAPPQTSLAFVESLTMPLVQEVVISADVRCKECQKRIAAVISRSRMNGNGETESVVVNLMERKVTVSCKTTASKGPLHRRLATTPKFGLLLKIIFFCSPT